eukprot:GHUV01017393.1.p1 GENE.GHUV01017393.1~~GHUV01017393.1.p1  ORF type:complete len:170 (+),score=32.63 GHUV01017393.1:923-1432(+)
MFCIDHNTDQHGLSCCQLVSSADQKPNDFCHTGLILLSIAICALQIERLLGLFKCAEVLNLDAQVGSDAIKLAMLACCPNIALMFCIHCMRYIALTIAGCLLLRNLQVERLSGLIERAKELNLDAQVRLDAINSSVNIHTRIVKFFELVENDLYGKLQKSNAQIAVYRG